MSKSGPIIVVEDDEDDQFIIRQSLSELKVKNDCLFFANGQLAFDFLSASNEQPFLILCDMNMPVLNGLELRRKIESDPHLKSKAIPFVFLSTTNNPGLVRQAYEGTIQGYYKKADDFKEFKENLKLILGYWQMCLHPNNLPN